jgi:hypothetical protein
MPAQEIFAEAVKTGFIIELFKMFPGTMIYKENIVNPVFPHFFVEQLTLNQREDRRHKWFLNYFMTTRYRAINDPALAINLHERLDAVALPLMEINTVMISGMPIRIKDAHTDKEAGVLHYFCNVIFQVEKAKEKDLETDVLQMRLILNRYVETAEDKIKRLAARKEN